VIDWRNHGIGWSSIRSIKSAIRVCRSWLIWQLFRGTGSLLKQMILWPENRDQCLLFFDQKALSIFSNLVSEKWRIIVIGWLNHGIGGRSTCTFSSSFLVKSGANFLQLVGRASLSLSDTFSSDLCWSKSYQKATPFKKSLFQIDGPTIEICTWGAAVPKNIIETCGCPARFSQQIRLTSAEFRGGIKCDRRKW
jgi:hypothetical protein